MLIKGPDVRGTGKREFINLTYNEFEGLERQENQDDFPGLWSGLSIQSTNQVRNTGEKQDISSDHIIKAL